MSKLFEKFKSRVAGQKIWPPINNVSFFIEGSLHNLDKYFTEFYRKPVPMLVYFFGKETEGVCILTFDVLFSMSREIFGDYWQDPQITEKISQQYADYEKEVEQIYNQLTYKYIEQASEEELLAKMIKIKDAAIYGQTRALFTGFFDEELCQDLLANNNVKFEDKKFKELWGHGMEAVEESFDKRRLRIYLELKLKNTPENELLHTCQFFPVGHMLVPTLEEIKNYLNEEYGEFNTLEKIKVKLAELDQERQVRSEKLNTYKKDLNSEEKKLVDYLQFVIEKRDIRKDILGKEFTIIFRVAQRFLKEANISELEMKNISFGDLMYGVEHLKKIKSEIVKRGAGFCAFMDSNGTIEFDFEHFDEDLKLAREYYLSQQIERGELTEIKGKIGSPGKIKGKVKVVTNIALQGPDLKEGDVLVAGMTRPDYLPLMKKAGAFVTDEGGVTCHAAIVGREMKKPCVIGTKIATHVLKDGMEVEVDADRGIVRIIK